MSLAIGSSLPKFSLKNQNNETVEIQSYLGSPLVIFFYPKDNTTVCTIEACTFEQNYDEFKSLDADIIGISADSPKSHQNFAAKHGLTITLLSDPNHKIADQFELTKQWFGLVQERTTFIFDKEGSLTHKFSSQLNGKKHIKEALDSLRNNN